MNFWSFANFLEFPGLFLIQKMINDISIVSLLRQQVNWVAQSQTWRLGPTGQCNRAGLGGWHVEPVNGRVSKVNADVWVPVGYELI